MAARSRIVSHPSILRGKPVIRGTRVSVEHVLDLISSGLTPERIAEEHPHLSREDVLAAVHYAAQILKREEILPLRAR